MEDNKQRITLQLDAHRFQLVVNRSEEQFYREGAELLNSTFKRYQRSMPTASVEELWMYVALRVAVNLCCDAHEKDIKPVDKKLQAINQMLEQYIQK